MEQTVDRLLRHDTCPGFQGRFLGKRFRLSPPYAVRGSSISDAVECRMVVRCRIV